MNSNHTIIIGISGASASGKSLLANTLVNELGSDQVAVIEEDCYYKDLNHLPFEERAKTNFDHPESLDHKLLISHLRELQQGNPVEIPQYDFSLHQRKKETRNIGRHRIIVLEGILLFVDQQLRKLMDIRIFMDTALDVCLIRRLKRDLFERDRSLESVLEQYQNTVRPMYLQFIEPSKRYADVIVPRGGENRIAIDMIKAKMRELLG
ncbi:MAG: uridine kinase [Gammaproteobacteria bacterium RIFCSPLOWO2_02_FULL_42_14]|nr:MAG: uridine kinase [Gammaproteobacteria bacterium RIFCSPHIGHO2_02_FULL_42_43]OGT29149.1 MAG: uridine kinase [Gammaproteobacteria bacterium RIFCSPHIGHO2_01_FULL_42_8]OGT52945.1 MAG: uridine kinase [Gammaproteobacteria bacterium RIFCSPHIGHO2_12_FULL_41_25]OGT61281.1 MAG: uridine kinase [Gammaproteobacteria bacterium RIFCSPLOWO2_02_FULL_42_14]OGT87210.1 MAG: uridine kinase [Gammaproteobacteria bacterium RIFCSPLOWO2_12_FULL_42_18]